DHPKHAKLFPACTSCHSGAAAGGAASLWPDPVTCASCHDGTIQPKVTWRAPTEPRRSNLKFDHQAHARAVKVNPPACSACHTEAGAPRMAVRPPVVGRCLDCHEIRTAHLAAPDTACATCHLSLARAVNLTGDDVARFPAPPSHGDPRWLGSDAHGAVARSALATNCSTCHAREFCHQCHAGGAPPKAIAVLASDLRSLALVAHRAAAYARETSCMDCHSERSFCATCHEQSGLVASRGLRTGYHDARPFFVSGHGGAARQSLESCVSCHAQRDCLPCHSAQGGRRFNPHGPGFDADRLKRKNYPMCTVCHGTAVP